jgi:hypothetical protein
VDVVENVAAEGDDLRQAVVVAVLRAGRYEVIDPCGFGRPFILSMTVRDSAAAGAEAEGVRSR